MVSGLKAVFVGVSISVTVRRVPDTVVTVMQRVIGRSPVVVAVHPTRAGSESNGTAESRTYDSCNAAERVAPTLISFTRVA